MPYVREMPEESSDRHSRPKANSDVGELTKINSRLESLSKTQREQLPRSLVAPQVRVIGRGRILGDDGKCSSPNDTDSPSENEEDARRHPYKRKHRRCWDTSRTALQQDSESDSAPLLSSSSQRSAGPVMFPNSETSDLDESIVGGSSRYGSIGAASFNSIVTVLPKTLSPLVQESPPVISKPEKPTIGVHFSLPKFYDTCDMDMILSNEQYEENEPLQGIRSKGRGYERINLSSTLELGASLRPDSKPKQSSLVTIFSIWNTILGSSLLTMPWGILMAGLVPGLAMLIGMSGLCVYTAYRLLKVHKYNGGNEKMEVPELCRIYLGSLADHVARVFSITVLLGANIAYWILMSNFLYNSVNFLYDNIVGIAVHTTADNLTQIPEVLCPKEELINYTNTEKLGERSYDNLGPVWDLYRTVPLFLAVIIFPLLNFNTTTFFTKFNSLGTASIVYLIGFVIAKATSWGINMSLTSWENSWRLRSTFPAMTGMLTMSFFIHNIIITIMQHNRDQSKNGRDLSIAYTLVTLTYLTVGTIFYVSFPLAKFCIEDNFLNNFQKSDGLTTGARVVLLFQLLTVYPLINYMLRIRLLSVLSPYADERKIYVILVNLVVVTICILFARFMPYIGTVIRYTGAISGMIYVFTLPSLLHLTIMCKKGEATIRSTILHLVIPVIGAANLLGQLFVRAT